MKKKLILHTFLIIFSSACTRETIITSDSDSAPKNIPLEIASIPDAVPIYEKRTRAGNPAEYDVFGKHYKVLAESKGYQEKGIASWYGPKFHGKKTSNGEIYDMHGMTAAHKTLPIPCYVKVTNLKNRRSIVLRVNDRGPFHENRIIDLSYTAAVKLGIHKAGTGFVEVVTLEPGVSEPIEIEEEKKQLKEKQKATPVFLQVGAFSSQFNARQLQKKLLSQQISNSRVLESQMQGDSIYLVQVGPLNSVNQADEVNEKLAVIGLKETQIVVE